MSDCYRVAVLDLMNRVSIVSVPDPIADNAVFVQDNDSNHFSETDLSNSKHDVWKHSMALPRKKFHRSSQEEKPIPIVTFQDLWEELPSCLSTTDFKIGESCWQSVELFIHQNLAVMLLVLLGTTLTSVGIIFLLLLFIVVRTMRRT